MTQIGITLEANVAEALRKIDQIAGSMKKVEEAAKKTANPKLTEEYKQAAKEAKALERAAKRVYDETRTPAEQHNRKMAELNELLKQGKIDQETYNRAARQGADANREAFGDQAVGRVKNFVIGLAAGVASLQTIKQLMLDARQISDDAGKRIVDDESARRSFRQVAGGDQATFDRLLSERDRLRQSQGLTPEEAAQLVFGAASAGDTFLDDVDLFASLKDINFSADAGITSAQKLQAAFGGEAGAGSSRQILNKILAAAGPSPVMADQIAGAASITSVPFAGIGGSDEELLALLGVLSEATRSPDDAGQKIKSLSDQIFKKRHLISGADGLEGLELIRALPRLAEAGQLTGESGEAVNVQKFLGEANAMQALAMIQSLDPKVSSRLADVNAAQAGTGGDADLLARAIGLDDVQGEAAKLLRTSTQGREVSEEDRLAAAENLADAIIEERVRMAGEGMFGSLGSVATRRTLQAGRFAQGSEDFAAVQIQTNEQIAAKFGAAAERLGIAAENLDQASRVRTQLNNARDSE